MRRSAHKRLSSLPRSVNLLDERDPRTRTQPIRFPCEAIAIIIIFRKHAYMTQSTEKLSPSHREEHMLGHAFYNKHLHEQAKANTGGWRAVLVLERLAFSRLPLNSVVFEVGVHRAAYRRIEVGGAEAFE